MTVNLTDPIFSNEEAARAHFEAMRWPNGPICPHCGVVDAATELKGKSTRPGVYKCKACEKPFTATIGTVYERSHIPLHKWLLATHLLCASKKGISAHQLWRMLGFGSYRTAWFMAMRIREGMRELPKGGLGGANKVVEIDETYVGGKEANKHAWKRTPGSQGGAGKAPVLSLVERDGSVRSFHVPNVTAETLGPVITANVDKASYLMTDGHTVYPGIAADFAGHGWVNHSIEEYVRAHFWHTNTVENYFSIFKRGIVGVYHHVSEIHLHSTRPSSISATTAAPGSASTILPAPMRRSRALPASGLPTDSLTAKLKPPPNPPCPLPLSGDKYVAPAQLEFQFDSKH